MSLNPNDRNPDDSAPPNSMVFRPSLLWRAASSALIGTVSVLSRAFLYAFNNVEVVGLPAFLDVLERRKKPEDRTRGLITGQVLPTHRILHSRHGGLFQPTMTQSIMLLSSQPYQPLFPRNAPSSTPHDSLTHFTTNGEDRHYSPAWYSSRRCSWVHIFPEGFVHQKPDFTMRYFKWGVSRLILEAEPAPELVPMFVAGIHNVMNEKRTFPRFLPRIGNKITVMFGDSIDTGTAFADLRARWKQLVKQHHPDKGGANKVVASSKDVDGVSDELRHGREADQLRLETAKRVRDEVVRLRRSLGYPEEDPSLALAESWVRDKNDPYLLKHRRSGAV